MVDPHLSYVRSVTPHAQGCEDCLRIGSPWVHLRLCLTCGHVGGCEDRALGDIWCYLLHSITNRSRQFVQQVTPFTAM